MSARRTGGVAGASLLFLLYTPRAARAECVSGHCYDALIPFVFGAIFLLLLVILGLTYLGWRMSGARGALTVFLALMALIAVFIFMIFSA